MSIYIVVFIVSILSTYFAEKYEKKSMKKEFIFFSAVAILIPSILAGLRHSTIGYDTDYYGLPTFNKALTMNFTKYRLITFKQIELGYGIMVFVLAKLLQNFQIVLFVTHFLIMYYIYKFIYNKRDIISMPFGMAIFLFAFYNRSLNLMRQTIAMAIIMYSLTIFEKRKYLKTFIYWIVAFLFHKTSIFALPMYFLIFIANLKGMTKKNRTIIYAMINIILLIIILNCKNIIKIFVNMNLLPERFYDYFITYSNKKILVKKFELFLRIFYILGAFNLLIVKRKKDLKDIDIYLEFLIIDAILLPVSFLVSNANRLGLYYYLPGIIVIVPNIYKAFKQDRLNKVIVNSIVLSVFILYWHRLFILQNNSETYPYKFYFQQVKTINKENN